jgi:GR25 family glycosyltransferase involved in LPS biosynthesis
MEILAWQKANQSWYPGEVESMQNFFDHIYVLNLDKRLDRWQTIQKQLHRAGITKAIRFPGIARQPGWIGCYESHLAMLQKAKDTGARNVLILEDDAELYSDWQFNWRLGKRQIRADWDMLYLGYNLDPAAVTVPPQLVASNMLLLNDALTTHAYAVNLKCLDGLITHVVSNIDTGIPIDVVYARYFNHIKAYGIYPMLFHQAAGMSDILGCESNFPLRQNIEQVLSGRR